MENQEKYYTPTIDEFCFGFEFQEYCISKWADKVIDVTDFYGNSEGETIFSDIICKNLKVRVKYLDKSDIESLGFDHDYNLEPIPNKELNPVYEGFYFQKEHNQYMLYYFNDHELWIELTIKCSAEGYIFKGTIKNKSELKILLKQLGII